MSREVLVRFIGRFALVQERNQLRVIAVDMTFNPALGIPEHHPSLIIDTQRVSSGREHAESSIVPPVASAEDIVEYSRWALKGCELTFGGVEPTAAVTFTATNPIRSLASLHPGVRLNPAALDERPDGTAVAARVALSAGSVTAARQRKTDLSSYVFVARADTRVPDASRIATAELLADAVEATFTLAAGVPLTLSLRCFSDQTTRTITVPPRPLAGDTIVLSITNLCPGGDSADRDVEFAALYELLQDEIAPDARKIPLRVSPAAGKGVESAQCDNLCMI
jgi:hypothetical protein